METLHDTICAVATPAGSSPAAIVRLSGAQAFALLEGLTVEPPCRLADLPSYSATAASLRLRRDGPLVPATFYLMPAPRSYTRQDVAEVHTLGSPPLLRLLLDALVQRGARLAGPGEFTRRAFLNGRIDLAQAEAVLAAVEASTAAELRAAQRVLAGHPSRHIRSLHDSLLGLRARVEASIDFAEQDIELVAQSDLLGALDAAVRGVDRELEQADAGTLPPEGARVALCGLPNAGKSSLFNALLGRDCALVTDVPGTTRDAVAQPLVLGGVRLRLYDTAGLASPTPHGGQEVEAVDAQAIARARGVVDGTHIAIIVVDASTPITETERELRASIHAPHELVVLSKSDLPAAIRSQEVEALARGATVRRVSALTGEGIEELKEAMAEAVRGGQVDLSPSDVAWNARHREALRGARKSLRRARDAARRELGAEFVAADLRLAHEALGTITGQSCTEDVLDVVFAEFCIGK